MAVDFATFLNVAPHIIAGRLPILIRGRHGVGQSIHLKKVQASWTFLR